ncbi:MAG: class I SAM-dependent methyltransferase [Burkholderiales bacterium]
MTANAPRTSYWNAAFRNRLASPLTPHRDDVENVRKALEHRIGLHLLLGVTPEYGILTEHMLAVDRRAAVISDLWVPRFPERDAVHANWLQLPFREQTFAAVIGDGCLNALPYPLQYGPMFDQLRRVLKPGGRVAMRTFVTPALVETCEYVCRQAMSAAIGSFHAFKWRLAMAMVGESGNANIRVADIHRRFGSLFPKRDALAAAAGWARAEIETIEAYANSRIEISFPALSDVRQSFSPTFREIDLMYGSYELAQCCPVFVLQARQ